MMRSLGSRLTWGYALVVLCTVSAAMLVGYFLLRTELLNGVDLLNDAEFREIRARVEGTPRPVPEEEFLRRVAEHAEIDSPLYFFQVRGEDGRVRFRSPNMGGAVFPPGPPRGRDWTDASTALGMVRIGRYRAGTHQVLIAASLRNLRQFAAYYWQASLLVTGFAFALSVFSGHRLSRLALDPIRRIRQTAARINADNLGARIPAGRGNDEIAGLVTLLNQMFDRLERSFERLGRFAGDASHELKTPLSLIRLQSEKLLLHGNLTEGQQEIIQQQLEGIERLGAVIEKLLFLARSQVGGIRPNARAQDTAAFIRDFEEDARALCEDQQVRFEVARSEGVLTAFDAALLRHVLLNLLTNALRVTPAGGVITLASLSVDGRWTVQVDDPGPGLPAAQLERIFEPFARAEAGFADGQAAPGTGLGLAICRGVLQAHDGHIRAENRQPGPGLRVTFELPVSAAPEEEVREAAHDRKFRFASPAV